MPLPGKRRRIAPPGGICPLVLAAALMLLAACASPPPPPAPIDVDQMGTPTTTVRAGAGAATPAGTPADAGSVTVVDFQFLPPTIVVRRRAPVTWTDNGPSAHRIVADSGVFDKGQMAAGQSVAESFPEPGAYAYHCAIHPAMRGRIIVQ